MAELPLPAVLPPERAGERPPQGELHHRPQAPGPVDGGHWPRWPRWSRWWPGSLQWRITLGVLTGVGLLWLAVLVATWFTVDHELDELLDGHLAQAAALLVAQQMHELAEAEAAAAAAQRQGGPARTGLPMVPPDAGHQVLTPQLHRYGRRAAFQVFSHGQLVLSSTGAPSEPMLLHPGQSETLIEDVDLGGETWRALSTRVPSANVQVVVAEQALARHDILLSMVQLMLWPMVLMLPLLAVAVATGVRRGMKPLRSLRDRLAARQAPALQAIELPEAPAEMRPMLNALNGLFARVQSLLSSERRFTADAAHELRTPLAAIRAQAQVAMGATGDADRRHALESVLAGCDRATRMIGQLLTLARLEAAGGAPDAAETASGGGRGRGAPGPGAAAGGAAAASTDLSAVLRQVLSDLAPAALARDQNLVLEGAQARLAVRADAALLGVLARNLVDNALRYSPDGATVLVTLGRTAGQATELVVEDSGDGLCAADRERLGERFFRVLGTGQSGSGLGWSIVRRIALAQGAHIGLDASPALGGLMVVVRWPDPDSAGPA